MSPSQIKDNIINAFKRFLTEAGPYWSKSNLEKLIAPNTLSTQEVKEALDQ